MMIRLQKGYGIVFVIILFGIVSFLSVYALKLSVLEGKVGYYMKDSQQAFYAAETGISLAMESIFAILSTDYAQKEDLPHKILLTDSSYDIGDTDKKITAVIGDIKKIEQDNESCTYVFTSQGISRNAQQKLKAEVRYKFRNYYIYYYDEEGNIIAKTFSYREYLNRGEIAGFLYE